ncbi:hypothetical protein [Streptomyces thermodiastaticus]|uniref:hypothetical protein n=1 Tax=Streptomyces thermodiastaticus TaxID=44061 RepID=UPI001E4DF183|nr:hypothetical protein [Streptomyces thermodiastaticus]MCE7552893.1 hypothetical protein [Streptomyces thermodiastaticus]
MRRQPAHRLGQARVRGVPGRLPPQLGHAGTRHVLPVGVPSGEHLAAARPAAA